MNPAIIAAVKVCLTVGTPLWINATNPPTAEYSYPDGYERCPDIIAERDREAIADSHRNWGPFEDAYREAYRRGVEALKDAKAP